MAPGPEVANAGIPLSLSSCRLDALEDVENHLPVRRTDPADIPGMLEP
jgi:hypothetical protein